jgi:hypothetical protein
MIMGWYYQEEGYFVQEVMAWPDVSMSTSFLTTATVYSRLLQTISTLPPLQNHANREYRMKLWDQSKMGLCLADFKGKTECSSASSLLKPTIVRIKCFEENITAYCLYKIGLKNCINIYFFCLIYPNAWAGF